MNGIATLRDWWFIILFAISMVAAGVTLNNKANTTETNLTLHCEQEVKKDEERQELKSEMREIRKDLGWLKDGMEKNEKLSYEILKEIRK